MEGPDAVLEVLEGVHDLYVTRGKKILHFDLTSGEPDQEEILSLVLGRSGKLRSPAMKTGTTMLVGYTSELLESQLL